MNPFSEAIQRLGLSNQNQGDAGWLYLLLATLAEAEAANPQVAVYADPLREVVRRLDTIEPSEVGDELKRLNGNRMLSPMLARLREMIGARL